MVGPTFLSAFPPRTFLSASLSAGRMSFHGRQEWMVGQTFLSALSAADIRPHPCSEEQMSLRGRQECLPHQMLRPIPMGALSATLRTMQLRAITRQPGPELSRCELSFLARTPIDLS